MKLDKSKIKRILFITLSNLGDIILTTPVLSVLEREFPNARLDVMVGPNGEEIFKSHPKVFKVIIYNKHSVLKEKRRLINKLRKMKYDLIVDLRNSLFPFLIGAKYRTSPIQKLKGENLRHRKDKHLMKLKPLGIDITKYDFPIHTKRDDQEYIERLVGEFGGAGELVIVSPGAKSLIKRWTKEGFIKLCDRLIEELKVKVIMIGDQNDRSLSEEMEKGMQGAVYNLTGKTSITQLAYLLKKAKLLITNDSAPLHLGCAMGIKVLAIFGPTDPRKYGPQGRRDRVVRKKINCSPCEEAQCRYNHECMKSISTAEVFEVAKNMLTE